MVAVNSVLKSIDDGKNYRILWASQELDIAYLFDMDKKVMPCEIKYSLIAQQIEEGKLELLLNNPYVRMVSESQISEKSRQFRDRIWTLIEDIVLSEPDIYDKQNRNRLIAEKVAQTGKQKKSIHRYLIKYWLYGKNKNAFLPEYTNSGGIGKERATTSGDKKRGRPRKYGDGCGINTDDETKHIFEKAIRRFYHTQNEYTFKSAYEMMLKEYYAKMIKMPDGTQKTELLPLDQIPTIGQFRYWYSKNYDIKDKVTRRKGEAKYSLDHRSILGKSDFGVMGPGAKYQIDATVGDVYFRMKSL